MSCERYWQKGIELAERGEPDPHRETCGDCQREHLTRSDLISLFPLIDAGVTGDANWQARVWQKIARSRARRPHGIWFFGSALVTTLVLVLLWLLPGQQLGLLPMSRIEYRRRGSTTRSVAKDEKFLLYDEIYIHVNPGEETRLYRDSQMLQQCSMEHRQPNCVADGTGLSLEAHLSWPTRYQIMTIGRGNAVAIPAPTGTFEDDRQTLRKANAREQHIVFTVR